MVKTLEISGINLRIVDLRWLAPLNKEQILAGMMACARILVVDECRSTGSQSEALMALFSENLAPEQEFKRIAAEDSFIPLGRAATVTLPSCDSIVEAALGMTKSSPARKSA